MTWRDSKFRYTISARAIDKVLTLENIKQAVDESAEIDCAMMSRKAEYVLARKVFLFIAYNFAGRTLLEVSKKGGLTNHATTIHHARSMRNLIEANDKVAMQLFYKVARNLGLALEINKK